MKAVMLSIRPEWCAKIARGEKTVEIRKTRPKLQTPFKCYIYCTERGRPLVYGDVQCWGGYREEYTQTYGYSKEEARKIWDVYNGHVMGEFVCDEIKCHTPDCLVVKEDREKATAGSCLTAQEIRKYLQGSKGYGALATLPDFYGWHISDLYIYDTPKELSEFCAEGDCDCMNCRKCGWYERGNGYNVEDDCGLVYEYMGSGKTLKPLFRPPQSWCYVEDLG